MAIQRCTRSVLLLSDFVFTGSGECAFYPTLQDANPDAVHSPARQNPLPFWSYHAHAHTCVTCLSLSQDHIGARRPRREAADGSRLFIESHYNLLRESRGSRGRRGAQDALVGTALTHARVRAGLVLARSRLAQLLSGGFYRCGCGSAFRDRRRGRPAQVRSH